MRGNPPGKDDSHGDAINWECLLEVIPQREDLYLIAEAKDFREQGSDKVFSPFLAYEWKQKKESKVRYYRRLSTFFKEKYPHIKLATELEEELLIDELGKSGSFQSTRRVLARLAKRDDFTPSQINEIAEAATSNNQIFRIASDPDIKSYMNKLVGGSLNSLDPQVHKSYIDLYCAPEPARMQGQDSTEAAATSEADEDISF